MQDRHRGADEEDGLSDTAGEEGGALREEC